jgi:hypothetical protein
MMRSRRRVVTDLASAGAVVARMKIFVVVVFYLLQVARTD